MNTIIVVISRADDSRLIEFGKLFGQFVGVRCIASYSSGEGWALLGPDGKLGVPLNVEDRPINATATIIHASDWDKSVKAVEKQLSEGMGKVFIFNGPGDPPVKDSATRILRATQHPFAISLRDAREILQFSEDISRSLPSCCAQPSHTLIALDILCQGFEYAHSGSYAGHLLSEKQIKETESGEWWMHCLAVSSLEELKKHLSDEKVSGDLVNEIEAGFVSARSRETLKFGVGRVSQAVKKALA